MNPKLVFSADMTAVHSVICMGNIVPNHMSYHEISFLVNFAFCVFIQLYVILHKTVIDEFYLGDQPRKATEVLCALYGLSSTWIYRIRDDALDKLFNILGFDLMVEKPGQASLTEGADVT